MVLHFPDRSRGVNESQFSEKAEGRKVRNVTAWLRKLWNFQYGNNTGRKARQAVEVSASECQG